MPNFSGGGPPVPQQFAQPSNSAGANSLEDFLTMEKTVNPLDANRNDKTMSSIVQFLNDNANFIRPRLTTEELAAVLRVKPQTIRAGLCNAGHYLGLRPAVKLPNRRLLWDAEQAASVVCC